MFRLINSHLQAYSLQVKSQDAVHIFGSQCVHISEIFKQDVWIFSSCLEEICKRHKEALYYQSRNTRRSLLTL